MLQNKGEPVQNTDTRSPIFHPKLFSHAKMGGTIFPVFVALCPQDTPCRAAEMEKIIPLSDILALENGWEGVGSLCHHIVVF